LHCIGATPLSATNPIGRANAAALQEAPTARFRPSPAAAAGEDLGSLVRLRDPLPLLAGDAGALRRQLSDQGTLHQFSRSAERTRYPRAGEAIALGGSRAPCKQAGEGAAFAAFIGVEQGAAWANPLNAILSSLAAFLAAGMRPRTPLAKAIVLTLEIGRAHV